MRCSGGGYRGVLSGESVGVGVDGWRKGLLAVFLEGREEGDGVKGTTGSTGLSDAGQAVGEQAGASRGTAVT